MMPQGGGPPGAPPSFGDMPPQQLPKVYDGSPPPSPSHIIKPHPIHLNPPQVNHLKYALKTLNNVTFLPNSTCLRRNFLH